MSQQAASVTDRLRITGQLMQVQIAPGIYRGMEQQATVEGTSVEDIIREYLAPLVPERRQRGAA